MEKHEQDKQKPIDWNGDERRHAPGGNYKGDDRRKRAAANDDATDLVGAKPPIGDSDADEAEGR